jgi:hypothetical protein
MRNEFLACHGQAGRNPGNEKRFVLAARNADEIRYDDRANPGEHFAET